MVESTIVWLASYPRSGNTFLRTMLWQCLGLRSASVYPSDLGGNKALEEYVGHIEHDQNGRMLFPKDSIPLIKTHELPTDDRPAIYVIRDGRDACISMWKFYRKSLPIEAVVRGQHRFGTWASHVDSWHPLDRPNTLLLKYEKMVVDLSATLNQLSVFLGREIVNDTVPDRGTIAGSDGRWVKAKASSESVLPGDILEEFNRTNERVLRLFGYVN
jgi:hypothetical protein